MPVLDEISVTCRSFWTPAWRAVVFILAAMSIWSLLVEFYDLMLMRAFVLLVFLPATALLLLMCALDWKRGDGRLIRNVLLGAAAGLAGAIVYDIFRLPFVFAEAWSIDRLVPHLPLFKVFPAFGSLVLGTDSWQLQQYDRLEHLVGWVYHFSNGLTFGIMYVALIGDPLRRHWAWAILLAVVLELAMLLTPYPSFFGIPLTSTFVAVTLTAHVVFGVALGLTARWLARPSVKL